MSIKAQILVKNKAIDQYYHDGKNYVEGRKGSEYVIQLTNDCSQRKKVVVSVDGLNVISGDTDWSHGYIIDGYSTIEIPGWLKNENQVAKFVFSSTSKSYNQHNSAGDQNNIGVIGIAVYDEKITIRDIPKRPVNNYVFDVVYPVWKSGYSSPRVYSNVIRSNSTPSLTGSSSYFTATADIESVGTGWGNNKEFKTTTTSFNSNKAISQLIEIFYNSRKNLEAIGVVFKNKQRPTPNAFPGLKNKYCPSPY